MNKLRIARVAGFAFLLIFPFEAVSYAFHEGGSETYCLGCHNISQVERTPDLTINEIISALPPGSTLKGSDPSSTCLQCHALPGAVQSVLSNDGSKFTPGGDFYWLRKTFIWTRENHSFQSDADSHGHNVVAMDYGLNPDRRHSVAPGGRYPSSSLSCISCHDPHATISVNESTGSTRSASTVSAQGPLEGTTKGNYRLLAGVGYSNGSPGSGVTFAYGAPVAVADSSCWTETDSSHPAYGSDMSEWCANCHSAFLNSSNSIIGREHPSGNGSKLTVDIAGNYNSYTRTGDFNGNEANAYLALVPFESGISNVHFLIPSSSSGPGLGNENVMCLTCHRAHASAFYKIGRWDFQATLLTDSHPQFGDGGTNGMDVLNSYYGRDIATEFGQTQRQLCNKCHLKD